MRLMRCFNNHNGLHAAAVLFGVLLLSGCGVTNPVTGGTDLGLVSQQGEIEAGRREYAPARQAQGGDYDLDPALTDYVRGVGHKLARVADRQLPYEFVIVNDSTPNAWALPGGKIAVHRGLLTELDNEAELAAVLAHEIVHSAARHGAQNMERDALLGGALAAASLLLGGQSYADLAMSGAKLGASAVSQKYSRDAEREADDYGIIYMARAGYDPAAAISLQEKFLRLNNRGDADWLSGLFASHPPSRERVERNRRTVEALPQRPDYRGEETYRKRMARLVRSKPAYEAYEQGRKALARGELTAAQALADRALSIEPRESQFYALRGDIQIKRRDYDAALASYNRALEREDGYYRHYLVRGLLYDKLGSAPAARADLQRSLSLLPTKVARDHLVRINARS